MMIRPSSYPNIRDWFSKEAYTKSPTETGLVSETAGLNLSYRYHQIVDGLSDATGWLYTGGLHVLGDLAGLGGYRLFQHLGMKAVVGQVLADELLSSLFTGALRSPQKWTGASTRDFFEGLLIRSSLILASLPFRKAHFLLRLAAQFPLFAGFSFAYGKVFDRWSGEKTVGTFGDHVTHTFVTYVQGQSISKARYWGAQAYPKSSLPAFKMVKGGPLLMAGVPVKESGTTPFIDELHRLLSAELRTVYHHQGDVFKMKQSPDALEGLKAHVALMRKDSQPDELQALDWFLWLRGKNRDGSEPKDPMDILPDPEHPVTQSTMLTRLKGLHRVSSMIDEKQRLPWLLIDDVDAQPIYGFGKSQDQPLLLGRNPQGELNLKIEHENVFVNKQHGRFFKRGDDYYYHDTSTHGTLVFQQGTNRHLFAADEVKLGDGDRLLIGRSMLTFMAPKSWDDLAAIAQRPFDVRARIRYLSGLGFDHLTWRDHFDAVALYEKILDSAPFSREQAAQKGFSWDLFTRRVHLLRGAIRRMQQDGQAVDVTRFDQLEQRLKAGYLNVETDGLVNLIPSDKVDTQTMHLHTLTQDQPSKVTASPSLIKHLKPFLDLVEPNTRVTEDTLTRLEAYVTAVRAPVEAIIHSQNLRGKLYYRYTAVDDNATVVLSSVQQMWLEKLKKDIAHRLGQEPVVGSNWLWAGDLGEDGLDRLGRFYFSVHHAHAAEFWEGLSAVRLRLRRNYQQQHIKTKMKMGNSIKALQRGDSAVLYFHQEDQAEVFKEITQMAEEHPEWFQPNTPLFTAGIISPRTGYLIKGLSFAQDPGLLGASFGGLISDALSTANDRLRRYHQAGRELMAGDVYNVMAQQIDRYGFDIHAPAFQKAGTQKFKYIYDHCDQKPDQSYTDLSATLPNVTTTIPTFVSEPLMPVFYED